MTRHTRYAFGFLVVVLVVALGLTGLVPVQAQENQPTPTQTQGAVDQNQQGQGGNTLTLQTNDTLGGVLGRFNLTEEQVRQFLVANANLSLTTGQTVTFPSGVNIQSGAGTGQQGSGAAQATATPNAAGGANQATATPNAAGGTDQATATPNAAGGADQSTATPNAAGSENQATATPNAAGGANNQATATPTGTTGGQTSGGQTGNQTAFNCAEGNATPGQTYVTQTGDTLGSLLTMMGLDVQAELNTGGNTNQGQGQGTGQGAGAGQGADAQATQTPTGTANQGAGSGNTGNQGQQAGQVNTNQVVEFVYLNCGLTFDTAQAQSVVIPVGIPETGQQGGQTGQQGGQTGQSGQGNQSGQAQTYTVQPGETLTDIANRFGVTLEALIAANPDLVQPGTTINIPAQQSGQTGQQGGQTGQGNQQGQGGQTGQGNQSGGIPSTGQGNQAGQGNFASRLRHPYADPDRLGTFAIYVVRGGDSISSIARRFGMTVNEVLAMNPHVQNPNIIYSGQWILVNPGERPVINPPNWQNTGTNQNQ